jgi:K+-transporting ATPase ATPase C chain
MKLLITAILVTVVLTVLLGVIYPLAMTGITQALFPTRANGSLVTVKGKVVGSELVGQSFADAHYFHTRPSAAGDGYDPMKSGGSNLGPTNKALIDRIQHDVDSLHKLYPELPAVLPVDMVTSSASGLDPHISVANALAQSPVVAKANNLPPAKVVQLVREHVEGRTLGVLGEEVVNVLQLNLALMAMQSNEPKRE